MDKYIPEEDILTSYPTGSSYTPNSYNDIGDYQLKTVFTENTWKEHENGNTSVYVLGIPFKDIKNIILPNDFVLEAINNDTIRIRKISQ